MALSDHPDIVKKLGELAVKNKKLYDELMLNVFQPSVLEQARKDPNLMSQYHQGIGMGHIPQSGIVPPAHSHSVYDPGHTHTAGEGDTIRAGKLTKRGAWEALRLRLRIGEFETHGFKDLSISINDDKVYLFVVSAGGATILEDEEPSYPSDALVASLRLLRG